MKFVLLFFSIIASCVRCNRYANDMIALANFEYYDGFEDTTEYIRQLDLIANSYLQLLKKIDNDLNVELREAANYDLKSVNETVNRASAEIVNKMHSRQIVVDLILYQIQYAHQMYSAASAKYKGEDMNTLYEDLTFEPPMNRMVIYEWVNQMGTHIRKISTIGEKISEAWKTMREEINTNAVGEPEPPKPDEKPTVTEKPEENKTTETKR